MHNMPMCPMMMSQMQMPMMPMMQMPMTQMTMPMQMQMPNIYADEDDKDDEYFDGMHSEACHKMMPYVIRTVDKMEQKGDMIYEEYPDRDMVDRMSEDAYNNMAREMPEMSDDMQEERQNFGRRRFSRDLVALLLINELIRRRRRRRRHHGGYSGYDYGSNGYDYNDFYYNE